MAVLNYAEQYARALANAYPSVLHFAALRSAENDSRYQWVNGNTIKIPTLTTTGRVDADRDTITVAIDTARMHLFDKETEKRIVFKSELPEE